jgi:polyisoprenoid-binding protein YceI
MRTLALGAALALAALPALAAPPSWSVDKAKSKVGFTGSMNEAPFEGTFDRWEAQIAFDPNDLADSKVTATIDVASAKTGDDTRDETMPTEDWFSAKAFPKATFVSRKITAAAPGTFIAEGDLTLRGVTHPVTMPFALTLTGDNAEMTGSVLLDRSMFGVGQGQWKTGEAVALNVKVNLAIQAKQTH